MKPIVFNTLRALLVTLLVIGFLFAVGLFMVLSDPCPNPNIGDPESSVIAKYGRPLLVRYTIPSSPDGWRYTSRYLRLKDLPANALPRIENKALWYPCRWGDYTVIYIDKRGVVSDVLDGRS